MDFYDDAREVFERDRVVFTASELSEHDNQIRTEVIDLIDRHLWNYSHEVWEDFKPILEQLKGQNNTCFDCKYHFISDCYLECQIKDRINNDNICKNFEQLKENK